MKNFTYAVAFLFDNNSKSKLNLTSGICLEKFIFSNIQDYAEKINSEEFKDSVIAINSNFGVLENENFVKTFEINLNKNNIGSSKMTDFLKKLNEQFIENNSQQ